MAKVFTDISHLLPWTGFPTAGSALQPRRLWATVASAFFVVAFIAWALALLQQGVRAQTLSLREEPVAFQPSQMLSETLSSAYVSP